MRIISKIFIGIIAAALLVFISTQGYVKNGGVIEERGVKETMEGTRGTEAQPKQTESASVVPLHTLAETISYLRAHDELPDYYITKSLASSRGWKPSKGNLCDVLPGMMIGGDVFTNAQKLLPTAHGRVWHEADFDYTCGNRNAKRILYSSDGLIYTTANHYTTVNPAP